MGSFFSSLCCCCSPPPPPPTSPTSASVALSPPTDRRWGNDWRYANVDQDRGQWIPQSSASASPSPRKPKGKGNDLHQSLLDGEEGSLSHENQSDMEIPIPSSSSYSGDRADHIRAPPPSLVNNSSTYISFPSLSSPSSASFNEAFTPSSSSRINRHSQSSNNHHDILNMNNIHHPSHPHHSTPHPDHIDMLSTMENRVTNDLSQFTPVEKNNFHREVQKLEAKLAALDKEIVLNDNKFDEGNDVIFNNNKNNNVGNVHPIQSSSSFSPFTASSSSPSQSKVSHFNANPSSSSSSSPSYPHSVALDFDLEISRESTDSPLSAQLAKQIDLENFDDHDDDENDNNTLTKEELMKILASNDD